MTTTLVARPRAPLSWVFEVSIDDNSVGWFAHRTFGRPGTMAIEDDEYEVRRLAPGIWRAERTDGPGSVAELSKVGTFTFGTFALGTPGREDPMQLRVRGRRGSIEDRGEIVATLIPRSPFTRTLVVEYADNLPPAIVVLGVWKMIQLMRRRTANAI